MSVPIYLNQGRGRGRGRGRPPGAVGGATASSAGGNGAAPGFGGTPANGKPSAAACGGRANGRSQAAGAAAPPAAAPSRQAQAAAMQRHTEELVHRMKEAGALSSSSSGEEDDDDDQSDDGIASAQSGSRQSSSSVQESIWSSTLKMYQQAQNADSHLSLEGLKVESTRSTLLDACSKRGNVCLVCLETIKRTDAVWNCCTCYAMLHLQCAQQWAKEGLFVNAGGGAETDANASAASFWACPKCRHEYARTEMPSFYFCYCRQSQDPAFQPYVTPHSCGETCARPLKPSCGHECMLLCHPGACPPCPRTVEVPCHCGQSPPTTRRCVNSGWSCGKACDRLLSCGQHRCTTPCHGGECKPCQKQSVQPCRCGQQSQLRACAVADWSCEKVCGRELTCRNHVCESICHSGPCGDCPRGGERSCPCGKSRSTLPCSEDVPTCGDTCNKLLPCETHRCARRCHNGECEQCRQMVTKHCRCGRQKRSVPCSQELLCDGRCTRMRQCGRHPCKRRCCDGDCPPCDKTCSKPLQCRNHKCLAPCHRGPCYPCNQQESVSCRCGAAVSRVQCGRKGTVRPPRCTKPCLIPPDCHHPSRERHQCHMKDCPRCRWTCGLRLPGCRHPCPKACHDHLREKVESGSVSMAPWEQAARSAQPVATRPLPCPPCLVPVPRSCRGQHESADQPCSEQRDYSCGLLCARQLACGNHSCHLQCHSDAGNPTTNTAGGHCSRCEEPCARSRPSGCTHPCKKACHPGSCPPCKELLRFRCHCGTLPLVIKCPEYAACRTAESRDALRQCSDQCSKLLECGHRCRLTCHSGACSPVSECQSRVTKRCPCKRLAVKLKCSEAATAKAAVCDDACRQQKLQRQQSEEAERRKLDEEEDEKNKAEIAQLERQMRGKTRKRRQRAQEEVEAGWWERHRFTVTLTSLLLVALIALVYIFQKTSQMHQ